jgi:hypothetical protein
MNDFRRDNSGQRRVRDAVLVPFLYKNISMDGRFVLCDKGRFADILQRRMDVDTIVERENGLVAIEEKIVRWGGRKYTAVTLETDSCTIPGYETDGWMHYCEADKLLWVMCQGDGTVVYHVFGFPELQKVFWEAMEENDSWIKSKDVPYAEGVIDPGEEGRQIVREYNLQKRAYL